MQWHLVKQFVQKFNAHKTTLRLCDQSWKEKMSADNSIQILPILFASQGFIDTFIYFRPCYRIEGWCTWGLAWWFDLFWVLNLSVELSSLFSQSVSLHCQWQCNQQRWRWRLDDDDKDDDDGDDDDQCQWQCRRVGWEEPDFGWDLALSSCMQPRKIRQLWWLRLFWR